MAPDGESLSRLETSWFVLSSLIVFYFAYLVIFYNYLLSVIKGEWEIKGKAISNDEDDDEGRKGRGGRRRKQRRRKERRRSASRGARFWKEGIRKRLRDGDRLEKGNEENQGIGEKEK